jgi:diacylglycerol kinase family enzyme
MLAGAILHRARPIDMPFLIWRAFSRRFEVISHRQVSGLSEITELRITSSDGQPLPLQVDGDYLGKVTEARYGILPEVLSVVS